MIAKRMKEFSKFSPEDLQEIKQELEERLKRFVNGVATDIKKAPEDFAKIVGDFRRAIADIEGEIQKRLRVWSPAFGAPLEPLYGVKRMKKP